MTQFPMQVQLFVQHVEQVHKQQKIKTGANIVLQVHILTVDPVFLVAYSMVVQTRTILHFKTHLESHIAKIVQLVRLPMMNIQAVQIATLASTEMPVSSSAHIVQLENIQHLLDCRSVRIAQLAKSTPIQVQPLSRLALHARLAHMLTLQPGQQHAYRALVMIGHLRGRPAVICALQAMNSEVDANNVTQGTINLLMAALCAPHVLRISFQARVQHLAHSAAKLETTLARQMKAAISVTALPDIFSQTMVVHFHAPNAHTQNTNLQSIVPRDARSVMCQPTLQMKAEHRSLIVKRVLWDMKITVS